ncbi:MAG: ABC transporter permease [Chloroflexi bacterium]|nr:ABC transporter permease [Chloroflexota bacterium]
MIVRNLLRRKTRTVLTTVGIGIGIAAIVALVAIADGYSAQFTSMLTKSGADLTIAQADVADTSLSAIDEEVGRKVAAMPDVAHVSGMIFSVVPLEKMPYFIVFGYDPAQFGIRHFKIREGRLIGESRPGSREIMMGSSAARALKKRIGERVRIYGASYQVIGIYETGTPFEDGGGVITLREAQEIFKKPKQVSLFQVKLRSVDAADRVQNEVERRFKEITVSKSAEFAEGTQDVQMARGFAWSISAIAILAGGVGMMNTVLMSVFERTREIGVLRALGWRRRRVLWMILQESLLLSFLGGIVGVGLGIGLVSLLSFTSMGSWLAPAYSAGLFAQALGTAIILGAIGGLYPAIRAAGLSPVEALRYE